MNARQKLAAKLDHLGEDEREALLNAFRNAVLDEAADVLESTDDERCAGAWCCGLESGDFAEIVREMRTA
ncbi:hypothetical protein ACIBAI_05990 [Streptomyces sp. NPDC051041]|uniref:hypothetical protein n=1 Tax=Streptomyces sp. NPDC051041 TaxID=3365640 RepID=UPI003788DF23